MTSSEPSPATRKSVLASIRAHLASLPKGDLRVAKQILDDPEGTIHLTVGELATRAGTAESTVVRCCRKLGYRGFQDLKIHLARETAADRWEVPSLHPDATAYEAMRAVLAIEQEVLSDVTSTIGADDCERAVDALATARKVLLIGFGSSMNVCREAAYRLFSIGLDVVAPDSENLMLLAAVRLEPGDVALCVSHTGTTKGTIRLAKLARERGATVIVVTSFARTPLARQADVALVAGGRQLDFGFDALSGRTAHLAVLDALYAALVLANPARASSRIDEFNDAEARWRM